MYKFKILILNGPNLNLLGSRESNIYGNISLKEIINKLYEQANKIQTKIKHVQSNAEYILIDEIHQSKQYDYIIINPGALTHTSIALRDALLSVNTPFIEVHISNIYAREKFRSHSWLSDISQGIITGLGIDGYFYALKIAVKRLKNQKK